MSPQTYTHYENPAKYWTTTTQRPFYNNYDNNKYYDNNFWATSTVKSYVPKNDYYDNFDTSKYFDTSSFDTSKTYSATDFGAFDFKK